MNSNSNSNFDCVVSSYISLSAIVLLLLLGLSDVAQAKCYPGLDCPEDLPDGANPPPPIKESESPIKKKKRGEYSGVAHCSRTGATGVSYGESTPEKAIRVAIADCIRQGGIAQCCQTDARITSSPDQPAESDNGALDGLPPLGDDLDTIKLQQEMKLLEQQYRQNLIQQSYLPHYCCTVFGKLGPFTNTGIAAGQMCSTMTYAGAVYGIACY